MSDMNGNPHAEQMENYSDPRNSLEATATATLTLAYEQRTANLIAVYETMIPKHYGEPIPKAQRPIILKIRDDINERLGLNQETNK